MHPGVPPRRCVTDSGQQRPSTANCRACTGADAFHPHSSPAQKPVEGKVAALLKATQPTRPDRYSMQGAASSPCSSLLRVARSQGGRVYGGQDTRTLPRLQPRLPHWGEGLGWLGQPNFQKKLKVQTISCEIFHYLKDVFQSHRLWPPGQALVWNCRPSSTVRWRLRVFRVRKGLDPMSEWMFTRHVLVVIS